MLIATELATLPNFIADSTKEEAKESLVRFGTAEADDTVESG